MNRRYASPAVAGQVGLLLVCLTTACSEDRAPTLSDRADSVADTAKPCIDEDLDGFGSGCDTGRDCNDADPSITTNCELADCNRTPTAPGCECSEPGALIDCGEVHEQFGDSVICGYGRQTCDEGHWSGCRINTLPGKLRQALSAPAACPTNPCDPFCKEFLEAPNYSATPTGTPLCSIEATCQDGIQNQAEVGVDCEGPCPKACGTVGMVMSNNFSSGANGFGYVDDSFRSTNAASSASGIVGGGKADVTLGQVALSGPTSGGFTNTFASTAEVDVSFDWSVNLPGTFLSDECVDVMVSVDGVVYGDGADDFVFQSCGGGSDSGRFSFTSNFLPPGSHTLTIGGYLNKNASSTAVTRFDVENYTAYSNPIALGGNDAGRGGDDGFEASSDLDGGLNVSQLSAGDFIEWQYAAPETGTYHLNLRVASVGAWTQNLQIDGGGTTQVLSGNATGGTQKWQTVTSDAFSLAAGLHTVRLASASSQSPNINYLELLSPTTAPQAQLSIDNVLVTSTTGGVCGDNACNSPETCSSCPSDCGACPVAFFCGDATCDSADGETCGTCQTDCGDCSASCGNGTCEASDGETCSSCETDCGDCSTGPTCGNGICGAGEDCNTCASDCGSCACGNSTCEVSEDCSTCATDCGACPVSGAVCGDATCDTADGEDCSTCASDCGDCATAGCGDSLCNGGETCGTCATDCGQCSRCGDATCDSAEGETCSSCETDCGTCSTSGAAQVYLEAECPTSASGNYLNASTANVGASGTPHIRSSGNTTAGTFDFSSTDFAAYELDVASGSYNVYFLVNTQNSGADDSWYYRIDAGSWTTENNHSASGYQWVRGAGGSVSLSGTHTVEIANREDGLDIDRIAVVPTSTAPSGVSVVPTNCNTCGNSTVESGETCTNCATDVGACAVGSSCGDSVCDAGENCSNCATDCGQCASAGCGDASCNGAETCSSCATDCGVCAATPTCGDAVCDAGDGEDCTSCETDCGNCSASAGCGDSVCAPTEDCSTCALDCGVCTPGASCGDANCDGGESCENCATDCGVCSDRVVCGDAICSDGEDCTSCASDCGSCGPPAHCGDGTCDGNEDCALCAADCGVCGPSSCGDGVCESDEDCSSCDADCGQCVPMCPRVQGSAPVCGDSSCDASAGEHCLTCPSDCGACTVSTVCDNDSVCEPEDNEDCNSCASDCGACSTPRVCGDALCEPSIGESCSNCAADCGACQSTQNNTCGDSTCEPGETCDNCSADCGACPSSGTGAPFNTGVLAQDNLTIGQRVDINGDLLGKNVVIGNESKLTGTVQSEGNAEMGDRSQIDGTLEVGGSLTMKSGSYVGSTGTTPPGSSNITNPASVSIPSLPSVSVSPGSSDYIRGSGASPSTLAPGAYRDMSVQSNVTVTFTAGRYDFRSISFSPDAIIVIDARSGPVEWRIQNTFYVESRVSFTVLDDRLQWGVFSSGDIHVRPDVTFPSSLYAPNGTIYIEARGVVQGGIAAKNVTFDNTVTNIDVGAINTGWAAPPPPPTPAAPVCGDSDCTPETGESCSNCSADCSACEGLPSCGDASCDADIEENCSTCAADCGACNVTSTCGDGTCDADAAESCSTCEADCNACATVATCGDGVCDEDCSLCAADCGLCPAYQTTEFSDDFEITAACGDDQIPLWAGLAWDASTPGDSRVNIYFRSADALSELAAASEVLVAVAASSAGNGGYRYGPPAESAALENGFQYLDDVHIGEELERHNLFGRLRFELVPSSDGQLAPTLTDVRLQTSCETNQ